MKMKVSHVFLASALLTFAILSSAAAERKNWVLLIAGSSAYYNYRHQADVCHAYQIAHKNGIPDEQIVVMMYDDIAYNENNPYQGNIINKPNGPNVYPGVPKDYTGDEVNAKTFLKVLQGDQEGLEKIIGRKGKVINSGPDDYVFVNFADHGGPGILGMPSPPYLKARDVNKALKDMHAKKRFAKLTFYVEACESGSIFDNLLPNNISVYAVTAANTHESSWGCYCDNDRNTCLGDQFSISWMENTDSNNIHTETLEKQYDLVKARTNKSHVMQYGDKSFTSLTVDQFLSNSHKLCPNVEEEQHVSGTSVPTDMVGIHTLESLLTSTHERHVTRRVKIQKMLQAQLWIREQTGHVMRDIARRVYGGRDVSWVLEQRSAITNWDCYENSTDRLFELCPRLEPSVNDFVLRKMNALVNLCNSRPERDVIAAVEATVLVSPICY